MTLSWSGAWPSTREPKPLKGAGLDAIAIMMTVGKGELVRFDFGRNGPPVWTYEGCETRRGRPTWSVWPSTVHMLMERGEVIAVQRNSVGKPTRVVRLHYFLGPDA